MHRIADHSPRGTFVSAGLATLVACLVLLPLLGHRSLAEWDEAIYAEVSREMLTLGWLVPHWNQQLWFEKPPLSMWITAVFFRVFGTGEFWARAGSAFSGVAIVGLLHAWLVQRRDVLTAWLGTGMLLGTFGFLHACHVGETDVLLSLGCCIAVIGLGRVEERESGGWYFFWIGFAGALMTKSMASVVLPLSAIVLGVTGRWWADRFGRQFWLGLGLFLLLVLPWHLAMFHRFGEGFVAQYFGAQAVARATHQIEGHSTHWWYFLKVLLVSAPPFVLLYPVALARAFHRADLRAWAVFGLVVVGVFTVAQTRLPQYIVPAYPAFTVVAAAWLGERIAALRAEHRPRRFWVRAGVLATVVCVVSVWGTNSARKDLHSAKLADGTILPGNQDSIALLREAIGQPVYQSVEGPLLLWRQGRIMSIATDVFYSGRRVQQVELLAVPPGRLTDRYFFQPQPLDQVVSETPRLILLDSSLVPQIPTGLVYARMRSVGGVELGTIALAR